MTPDSLDMYAIHFPSGETRPSKWSKVLLGNTGKAFRSPNIGKIHIRWEPKSPRLSTMYCPFRVQSVGWFASSEASNNSRSPAPSARFIKMSEYFVPILCAEYATLLPSGDQLRNQVSSAKVRRVFAPVLRSLT